LDGDGSAIMHMGTMAQIGTSNQHNIVHIIFNNGAHDSVGAQPTYGYSTCFMTVAKGCGYKTAHKVEKEEDLNKVLLGIKG
jgi:phosphonopyruvate decarboxylase